MRNGVVTRPKCEYPILQIRAETILVLRRDTEKTPSSMFSSAVRIASKVRRRFRQETWARNDLFHATIQKL